ncbi:MAG: NAD(P)/FAD-dependent oxidoreductase [Mariniblastus sp.]
MPIEQVENLIVGGGIIGLSIAYELSKRGKKVTLIERDQFGSKASWAGAGIIIPANADTAIHPLEHLEALSHEMHEQWANELRIATGIDNGFRRCGGLYLARTLGESAALSGQVAEWKTREIEHEILDVKNRPAPFQNIQKCVLVPGESQFSNPHHTQALIQACRKLDAVLHENVGNTTIEYALGEIESISSDTQQFRAQRYILASGPWTEQLVAPTNIPLPMQPVRGQIALYKIEPSDNKSVQGTPLQGTIAGGAIINEGSRYLVPRQDGHVLAGATIEEVGFDCQTCPSEVDDLRRWAESITNELNESTFVKSWAGLRPGTYDGFPYIGTLGQMENVFVASGHFKGGLHLSTGTAMMIADLVEHKTPAIDLRAFCPSRAADHQSIESR